ncbi:MAG: hypothetical protein LC623_09205 [Halobacteriales archaeon]|nr:hypothetical protein [Halobacteriales archaeon]
MPNPAMPTKDSAVSTPIGIVLDKAQILRLFKGGTTSEDSVNEMGYDIRLGSRVTYVTRGGEVARLKAGDKITIYPGETILATSREVLNLDDDVCATGSPKMSLLLDGLWSHGGKTDFGFSSNLRLGFMNQGTHPITLEYEQPIFSIIFWQSRDKAPRPRRSASNHQEDSVRESPLDLPQFPMALLAPSVLERDGILAWRLVSFTEWRFRRIQWALVALGLGTLVSAAGAWWTLAHPKASTVIAIVTAFVSPAAALGGAWALLKRARPKALQPPWKPEAKK